MQFSLWKYLSYGKDTIKTYILFYIGSELKLTKQLELELKTFYCSEPDTVVPTDFTKTYCHNPGQSRAKLLTWSGITMGKLGDLERCYNQLIALD